MNTNQWPKCGKKDTLPRISQSELEAAIRSSCAPHEEKRYGYGDHTLYILPEPMTELENWVRFGCKRTGNAYEQQFVGMGHTFLDENDRVLTVVSRIIPLMSVNRGPAHARMVSDGNDTMLEILSNERRIQNELEQQYNTDENGYAITPCLAFGPSTLVMVGHTHPDIGCSFSQTDHRSNYSTPKFPMVSFVCDPIREDMGAMVGMALAPMTVVCCRPKPEKETTKTLWQQLSGLAGLLMQQPGVSGKLECFSDPRGRTHMRMFLTSRPGRGSREQEGA